MVVAVAVVVVRATLEADDMGANLRGFLVVFFSFDNQFLILDKHCDARPAPGPLLHTPHVLPPSLAQTAQRRNMAQPALSAAAAALIALAMLAAYFSGRWT